VPPPAAVFRLFWPPHLSSRNAPKRSQTVAAASRTAASPSFPLLGTTSPYPDPVTPSPAAPWPKGPNPQAPRPGFCLLRPFSLNQTSTSALTHPLQLVFNSTLCLPVPFTSDHLLLAQFVRTLLTDCIPLLLPAPRTSSSTLPLRSFASSLDFIHQLLNPVRSGTCAPPFLLT
jgi:hypothetical protein